MRGKGDPFLTIGEENDRSEKGNSEYVWALRDINLEVMPGEVLGIIGKNGAGKSTLLKILSKVTGPTTGKIQFNGRIGSLLEVGTGFHHELTGRENIYLNGAILGMTKAEIKSKLDEIIDFSGCERYIDTPVKRYSSGMMVRLGFAVAAHLEPEILVVDEVLAVGDVEFQKKAIGKMQDVSRNDGRTVLFVSHNMAAVKALCSHCVVLKNGIIDLIDDAEKGVNHYLQQDLKTSNLKKWDDPLTDGNNYWLYQVEVKAGNKNHNDPILLDDPVEVSTIVRLNDTTKDFYNLNYRFKDEKGDYLFVCSSYREKLPDLKNKIKFTLLIPPNFFNSSTYYVDILIVKNKREILLTENDILSFTANINNLEIGDWMGKTRGPLKPIFKWKIENEY